MATSEVDNATARRSLQWEPGNVVPMTRFVVAIMNDEEPEATEEFMVVVECEENCYLEQRVFTVTIMDDDGTCHTM